MKRFISVALIAAAVFMAVPAVSYASALTSTQVNAIIFLLQSFGADSSVIANVQSALGGGTVVTPTTPVTSATGALSVSTGAPSPTYTLVSAGSSGVTLGSVKLHATSEDIILNKIRLVLASGATPQALPADIVQLTLWDGGTQVGTGYFAGNQYGTIIVLSRPVTVPRDSDKTLTIKGDIAMVGTAQPARAGDTIQIAVDTSFGDTQGTGVSSGRTITATGSASTTGVRIFKSYPTVTLIPLPATGLSDGRLLRFSVTASPAGSIGLDRTMFAIRASNATIGNTQLYGFTDPSFSVPISGQLPDGRIGNANQNINSNVMVTASPQLIEIPAGATYYFELRAPVTVTANSSVSTTLLGDSASLGIFAYNTNSTDTSHMLWSPNDTTVSQISDADWTNGYGVPGLPMGGVSQTRAVNGGTTPQPYGITVTAPNGGEQWDEGVINSVTWTPYNYNPDINPSKDVTAYLEKKNADGSFTTLGKVEESGKASIHWITGELNSASQGGNYATPGGGYYIRVVNNVTGAWDRSNQPFTLLPRPIDLKLNGSDGVVTIPDINQAVNVSWVGNGVSACQISGLKDVSFSTMQPSTGSLMAHLAYTYTDYGGIAYSLSIQCVKNGQQVSDYVPINVTNIPPRSQASVSVVSPNGGEQIMLNQPYTIRWSSSGLASAAIALYKNDQWQSWITKYVVPSGKDVDGYVWNVPSEAQTGSAVYKLYITGQKADGTGYVDDKSDAPFSFSAQTSPGLTSAQAQAIVSLLQSFSAPQSVIANVQSAMNGGTIPATGTTLFLTQTQTSAIISLLGSFGASSSVIQNVNNALRGAPVVSSVTPTCTVSVQAPRGTTQFACGSSGNGVYVNAGDSITFNWSSTNAVSVNGPYGAERPSDFLTLTPASSRTYTWTFYGSSGASSSVSITVNVTPPASTPAVVPAPATTPAPGPTATLSFSKTPLSSVGEYFNLIWSSTNATSCYISYRAQSGTDYLGDGWSNSPAYTNGATSGTTRDYDRQATTQYRLTCTGPGGSATAFQTQTTTPAAAAPAPTCTLTAVPASVVSGGASTLAWNTQNAVSVHITPGDQSASGAVTPLSGSKSVSPSANTTYTLDATSATNSKVSCNATVTVTAPVVPAPTCTLNMRITVGPSGPTNTLLTWTTQNAVSATLQGGSLPATNVAVSGNTSMTPPAPGNYSLTVANSLGVTATCMPQTTVQSSQGQHLMFNAESVNVANVLTAFQALLNAF